MPISNLSIEGLSQIIQPGGGGVGGIGVGGADIASNTRVAREMEAQGMSGPGAAADGKSFGDMLRNSFDQVNDAQKQADTAIKELVAGRTKNIHETLLTIEKADASLKLAMQVRNKVLDAYKEIMRMQV